MTVREFVHGFSAYYLRSIYLKVAVSFGMFLVATTGDWTVAAATAGIPIGAALIAHLTRPRVEVPPTPAPRFDLKAPNPAPGQCPVCSLTDLDERAVGDVLLGDAGTALARVVPYGPDRAHAECAAVVPYVAPARDPQREIVRLLQSALPQHGDPIPAAYRPVGSLAGNNGAGAISLSLGRRRYDIPDGSVLVIAQEGVVREAAVVDHTTGTSTTVVVCRDPLSLWHPADAQVYASPLPPEPAPMPPVNGPLAAPVVNHTLRDSIDVPPGWSGFGVTTFAEVQNWRRHGFEPERAKAWIRNGFSDPQGAVATGFRWPNELRAANGWPLHFEPDPRCAPVVTEWRGGVHSGSFTLCRNPAHNPGDPKCTVYGTKAADG